MRIVGVVVLLMSLGIGIGGNLGAMLYLESFSIVCVGTLGMLLLGGSSIPTMFKSVFSSARGNLAGRSNRASTRYPATATTGRP